MIEPSDNTQELMARAVAFLVRHNRRSEADELRVAYLALNYQNVRTLRRETLKLVKKYVEVGA